MALATITPRADGSLVHPVDYGQSLWAIAEAYGATIDQLRAWNNLDPESSEIYAGQILLVRPAELVTPAPTLSAATPAGATAARSLPPAAQPATPTLAAAPSPSLDATDTPPGSTSSLAGNQSASNILLPVIGGLIILGGILLVFAARYRRT